MKFPTYTVRALDPGDAVAVERIAGNLASFRAMGPHTDMRDVIGVLGRLSVNVGELLDIIERITRPAGAEPTLPPVLDGDTALLCYPEAAEPAKHCRSCGFVDCEGATTGDCPRWPARTPAED